MSSLKIMILTHNYTVKNYPLNKYTNLNLIYIYILYRKNGLLEGNQKKNWLDVLFL